jgi:hypothetical protein
MQDSFIQILKLLVPEIIVDYFEQSSYKKDEEILHLCLNEINWILRYVVKTNQAPQNSFLR